MFWRLTICCAALGLLLSGCLTLPPQGAEPVQRSQPLLGTFVTITTYGDDRDLLHSAISDAFAEIRRIDGLLSSHKAESELSRLNAAAGRGPVRISFGLRTALEQAVDISEKTAGAFDVTIGPITQLWGFIWKEYRLPVDAELAPVLPLVGRTNLVLHSDGSAELLKSGMSLDFGGIGKGMAVDAAVEALQARGVQNAMVKVGGDLRVIGAPPGREFWEVQVEDPAKQGQRATLRLRSGALSTSGNYENYFEVNGARYSHIIDPRSGLPVQGIASCTVSAGTCTEADALATAFFVLGIERSLARFGSGYGIRWITTDLQTFESEKFKSEQQRSY